MPQQFRVDGERAATSLACPCTTTSSSILTLATTVVTAAAQRTRCIDRTCTHSAMSRSLSPAVPLSNTGASAPAAPHYRRSRKVAAVRSPSGTSLQPNASLASAPSSSSPSSSSTVIPSSRSNHASGSSSPRYSPYPTPTSLFSLLDSANAEESEHLLSLSNTRYPGAPGTALYKAREAAAKQVQAAKREADKKRREREELARLGVADKMGKRSRDSAKRSESPYVNGVNNVPTAPSSSAARRSARGDKSAAASKDDTPVRGAGGVAGGSSSRSSSVAASKPSVVVSSAIDHDLLPVPSAGGAGGSNTSSNGRLRKPASRGSSPVPLTAASGSTSASGAGAASGSGTGIGSNGTSSGGGLVHGQAGRHRAVKSPERAVDGSDKNGNLDGVNSNNALASTAGAGAPSGNANLPSGSSTAAHARLAATQPFQSSPLARDSISSFPSSNGSGGGAANGSAHERGGRGDRGRSRSREPPAAASSSAVAPVGVA
ncbi:unnamed protein product [Jaminaea pallidilutea]